MSPFLAEFAGTALLLVIGDGVVANVILPKTKGQGGGLIAITFGWAVAVFVGVYASASISGSHLNPAVTIALASLEKFDWSLVPGYLTAQLSGAMFGSFLMWCSYRQHLDLTDDVGLKLGTFCTSPSIRSTWQNLFSEIIGTFVLIMGVLFIAQPAASLGALDALPVALLVLGIGLGLGGPTGYAINPARDLGPRIMHALLPIKQKGGSDWGYSWVPVVGPIIGALLAAWVFGILA